MSLVWLQSGLLHVPGGKLMIGNSMPHNLDRLSKKLNIESLLICDGMEASNIGEKKINMGNAITLCLLW